MSWSNSYTKVEVVQPQTSSGSIKATVSSCRFTDDDCGGGGGGGTTGTGGGSTWGESRRSPP
ncbi:hypothetical protein HPB47_026689, partial [Ixodes persulcatus]